MRRAGVERRRGRAALKGLAFTMVLTVMSSLAGCSYLTFSDGVDYSGPYENEVGACAELAMKADLRSDDGPVTTIWVRNVTVDAVSEESRGTTLVAGETHTSDSARRVYEWDCKVVLNLPERTLTARITAFDLADERG